MDYGIQIISSAHLSIEKENNDGFGSRHFVLDSSMTFLAFKNFENSRNSWIFFLPYFNNFHLQTNKFVGFFFFIIIFF